MLPPASNGKRAGFDKSSARGTARAAALRGRGAFRRSQPRRPSSPLPAAHTDDDEAARSTSHNARDASPSPSSSSESQPSLLSRTSLSLSSHPLPPLHGMTTTLSQFTNLHKLDLSSLQPSESNPEGLTSLTWLGKAVVKSQRKKANAESEAALGDHLTWINLSGNPNLSEAGLVGLQSCTALFVLNLSHCALTSLPPPILTPLKTLRALVLNNNALSSLPSAFPVLPELNTLILSHNQLTSLPSTLPASLPALKKLSVSHNRLASASSLPDFSPCLGLREVRMNGNSQLRRLPSHLARWGKGADGKSAPGLEVLDVGECGLETWEDVEPLLATPKDDESTTRRKKGLANLSLRGNGVTRCEGYRDRLTEHHPTLKVLDNERIVEKVRPKTKEEKRREQRMLQKLGAQKRDEGYANRGPRAETQPGLAQRQRPQEENHDEDEEDEDAEDDEAAKMAAEMRRASRQAVACTSPSARAAAPSTNADAAGEERKKKHKRGGARVRKSTSTSTTSGCTASNDKPRLSSFFEPVPPASSSGGGAKDDQPSELVVEDVAFTPSAVPTSTAGAKGKRAKRSGKKARELSMADSDSESGGPDVKAPGGKSGQRLAWDHTAPRPSKPERQTPSTFTEQMLGAEPEVKQTSVHTIINVKRKRQEGREGERKKRRPFIPAAAGAANGKGTKSLDLAAATKESVFGNGESAWT
ncbi:hypothetical protein ACQY0O_005666 [Thecaphora frezii]